MENKKINAPEWAKYLGEFMTELPVNCLFNKGITGCGGTELALSNDQHTIVAMPFISLVKNKADNERYKDRVLGVYGSTTTHEIEQYIKQQKIWKIAVVYDSLPRVIDIFLSMDINPYKKCFLLVDEYHILFNQYTFRNKAVKNLLEIAPKFDKKTYMSATPLSEEFMLKELKELPIYNIEWPKKKEVTVIYQPVSSPMRHTIRLIKEKLNDKIFGNFHFFVNSVKFIKSILMKVNISPCDVRIVCADNERNKSILKGYEIGKPADSPCKINFYTSTCFEGCDIFDKEGKTYIISEGRNPNTLYDISTLFIQIIGRIRDSNYNNEVCHVVSNTYYKGTVNYNEYREMMEKEYIKAQRDIKDYNSKDINIRKEYLRKYGGTKHFIERFIYVDEKECSFAMDENLLKKSLLDYKIKTEIYNRCSYLIEAYQKAGLDTVSSIWINYSDKLKSNPSSRTKYKDLAEEYHKLSTNYRWGNGKDRMATIEVRYPWIKEAEYNLGIERQRELNFNTTLIKRELIKVSDKLSVKKIIELVIQRIGYQNPIDVDKAKEILQEVYNFLGINKKATASKLKDYFIIKESTISRDGGSARQIELVKEKTRLEDQ